MHLSIPDGRGLIVAIAGIPGFEPRLLGSEPNVLPLNYIPMSTLFYCFVLVCRGNTMYLLSSLRSCPNWCIRIRSKSTSWSQKWQMYRFFFLKKLISLTSDLAGPHGFEPGPKVPKTPVLPLHHGPIFNCYIQYIRYLLSCQVLIPACFSVVLVITLVTTWCPSFYHMDSSLSTSDCSLVFNFYLVWSPDQLFIV